MRRRGVDARGEPDRRVPRRGRPSLVSPRRSEAKGVSTAIRRPMRSPSVRDRSRSVEVGSGRRTAGIAALRRGSRQDRGDRTFFGRIPHPRRGRSILPDPRASASMSADRPRPRVVPEPLRFGSVGEEGGCVRTRARRRRASTDLGPSVVPPPSPVRRDPESDGRTSRPDVDRRELRDLAEASRPQALPARPDARAALPLQPRLRGLRQDPVPRAHPEAAPLGRRVHEGRRRVRRADGLDSRRRAAAASGDPRDRRGARQAQEVHLPLHQRDPAQGEARGGLVHAEPLPDLLRPHGRAGGAPRLRGRPRGHLPEGDRGHSPRGRARLPRHHEHHALRELPIPTRSAASSTR